MSKIVRGTMLLTGALFLSKFLGLIYVIPFNELVGETGGTLFQYAYIPYNILITISMVGLPLAVSKMVARYNSLGDYRTGIRVLRISSSLMIVTGLISFLILYFGADFLANKMIVDYEGTEKITVEDIAHVLKMVSFAIIIIPAMSVFRGFFQGYESMEPSAVSQVVEQFIRIIFLLTATFLVIKVYDGTIATAVGYATFAAFIGGLASWAVLLYFWKKRKPSMMNLIHTQTVHFNVETKDILKELITYAGPFIVVGLATSLYQSVDQFTFQKAMIAAGRADEWIIAFGTINFYGHKIIILPVMIATGLSLSIIPALTTSFTQNNFNAIHQQINQALQIIAVFVIPSIIGLATLSDVIYGSLFGLHNIQITAPLLAWYAPASLVIGLFTVTSSILQGLNEQRFVIVGLFFGLLTKITLNTYFIHLFGAKGAIFATILGIGISVLCNLYRIKLTINFQFKKSFKITLLVLILSSIMAIVVFTIKLLLGFILPYEESRLATVVMLLITVSAGGIVYLWLALKSTLLEKTLGNRVKFLNRFM